MKCIRCNKRYGVIRYEEGFPIGVMCDICYDKEMEGIFDDEEYDEMSEVEDDDIADDMDKSEEDWDDEDY